MREIITGRNPVLEMFTAKRRHIFRLLVAKGIERKGIVLDIFKQAQKMKVPVFEIERKDLDSIGENHQGLAVEVNEYPYSDLNSILRDARQKEEIPLILVLDVIQNPQNLGTLLRSAEAVGVHGVIIPARRAAEVTPAVVHASAGASEHMLIAQQNLAQAISTLKENNIWVMGLEGSPDAQPVEQVNLDGPLALVVGSEGEGLRELTRKSCDVLLSLPMYGKIGSLNAAVAGSIILYLALQARNRKK